MPQLRCYYGSRIMAERIDRVLAELQSWASTNHRPSLSEPRFHRLRGPVPSLSVPRALAATKALLRLLRNAQWHSLVTKKLGVWALQCGIDNARRGALRDGCLLSCHTADSVSAAQRYSEASGGEEEVSYWLYVASRALHDAATAADGGVA